MKVGNIQRAYPCWPGGSNRLPLGRSMQMESQTSPRTFAKEVKISAKTTSAKYIRSSEKKHLCIDLWEFRERTTPTHAPKHGEGYVQDKLVSFPPFKHVERRQKDHEQHEHRHRGHKLECVHELEFSM